MKGQDINRYNAVIYGNLYSGFEERNLNKLYNPKIENTNLYQIARIISERNKKTKVLKFNYDQMLEKVISFNFKRATYDSIYKNHRGVGYLNNQIFHPHGLYEYGNKDKPRSIVLSTYEYFEAYKSDGYAYKQLMNQLDDTNMIIGNSLSDYEEQKVFYHHYKNDRSSWHYIFLKKSTCDKKWNCLSRDKA